MLAVLHHAPRPPLGVALLGLFISALSSTLRLLPYAVLCGMITLSIWVPPRPANPSVVYYPIHGHPNHVYMMSASNVTPHMDETKPFELDAFLRFLIFLLAVPVTSILESVLFRPARDLYLQTVQFWFDMRYTLPAQLTGSWPDTWTPVLNALCSFQFVAGFIDGVMGNDYSPRLPQERESNAKFPRFGSDIGRNGSKPWPTRPAEKKVPSPLRTVHFEHKPRVDYNHKPSPDPAVFQSEAQDVNLDVPRKTFISPSRPSSSSPYESSNSGASSSISKNLSRVAGILFYYPPHRKQPPRPRFNNKAFSARPSNFDFVRLSHSTRPIRTSSPRTSRCDVMKHVEGVKYIADESVWRTMRAEYLLGISQCVEPNQFTGCTGDIRPLIVPQLSKPLPPILTPDQHQLVIPCTQVEEPIRVQEAQFPALFTAPHHDQRTHVYEPHPTAPTLASAAERLLDYRGPALGMMAFQPQETPEHMDLDYPEELIPGPQHVFMLQAPEQCPSAQGLPPPISQPRQDQLSFRQLSEAPPSRSPNDMLVFPSSDCSLSYVPPVLEFSSARPVHVHQGESPPTSQCTSDSEFLSETLHAPDWTHCRQPPTIATSVSQPQFIQPLRDDEATKRLAFNVLPDNTTPYVESSHHAVLATLSCSNRTEVTSPQKGSLNQPVTAQHEPTQTPHPHQSPRTPVGSSLHPQAEAIPRPFSPADSVRAIGEIEMFVADPDGRN
ncbi:hypothetical protein F5148DRAFT_636652 [Russula earlei]|uniref:Uncharacterized protein n=1 Tax=Russula earlei TaxID=71964 RepID=A0ACC0UF08_9AGAM|nr:hypothetical protein F5148DRAFT_636652 [Russula earlei]